MNRRHFLHSTGIAAAATSFASAAEETPRKFRAVIIGHTGHGDYGHGMELCLNHRKDVEVLALADADEKGRAAAAKRANAARTYADYREMLDKEKPDIAICGPRWNDQHAAIIGACLEAGAHVYSEKPFVQYAADGDVLLKLADSKNLKIAVAHQMRIAPNVRALQKAVADKSLVGDLLEIRANGKQDARAGAEDLVVLGCHLFDLMRFFAGDPQWCLARVETREGKPITKADKRGAIKEQIGAIAGDQVYATLAFPNSVTATFTSRAEAHQTSDAWGLTFIGSKGMVRLSANIPPHVFLLTPGKEGAMTSTEWEVSPPAPKANMKDANAMVVDDWLEAIAQNREPWCSGRNAAWANEMVQAVFASALAHAPLEFPLKVRTQPFDA
jgi:predicted dehydrogenase